MTIFNLVQKIENSWEQLIQKNNVEERGFLTSNRYLLNQEYRFVFEELSHSEQLCLIEELLSKPSNDLKSIALDFGYLVHRFYDEDDFWILSRWAEVHTFQKTHCDEIALSFIGPFLINHPRFIENIVAWSTSSQWQLRRVAAITMIYTIRRHQFYREMFVTANNLRLDPLCEIREAFRWLLRESKKVCPLSVENYVRTHQLEIPESFVREILHDSYPVDISFPDKKS